MTKAGPMPATKLKKIAKGQENSYANSAEPWSSHTWSA